MADPDSVDITVRIKNKFSDEIEGLKAELESIQDKVTADLEVDDNGDINWAKVELESLERLIEAVLELDTKGIAKAHAELESLNGRHTKSTHTVDVHRDGDTFNPPNLGSNELSGVNQMGFNQDDLLQRLVRGETRKSVPDVGGVGGRLTSDPRMRQFSPSQPTAPSGKPIMLGFDPDDIRVRNFKAKEFELPSNTDDMLGSLGFNKPTLNQRQGNMSNRVVPNGGGLPTPFSKKGGSLTEELNINLGGLNKKIKKLFPTTRKWMNLIAALLPMIIALGGAVMGLVAAFGALAAAGVSILGLGLLGWGDSLGESMEEAKRKIKETGEALYSAFKPAMEVFQPLVDGFLTSMPSELRGLAEAMKGFTKFEGILGRMLKGFVNFMENSVRAMVDMRAEITQLADATMQAMSGKIIGYMKRMIQHVLDNWEAFKRLGGMLLDIVRIVYRLSVVLSKVLVAFAPLLDIIATITSYLNNKFVVGLLTTIATAYALVSAISMLGSIMAIVAGNGVFMTFLSGLVSLLTGVEVSVMSVSGAIQVLNAHLSVTRALIAGITGGLSLVAGYAASKALTPDLPDTPETPRGGGSGGYSSGGGDTYVMNVDGNARDEHMEQFKDMAETREYWTSSEENARSRD